MKRVPDAADTLQRFTIGRSAVRGSIISLDASWREVVQRHPLTPSVLERLGELTAAGPLLASSLRFDGSLTLQIHGDGPIAVLVVECDARGSFRATVKARDCVHIPADASLADLVNASGRGRFVVTLDPRRRNAGTTDSNVDPAATIKPGEIYQGIVPFEGTQVGEVLENYMLRSEQVESRLWLAADSNRAVGLLLQRMPNEGGTSGARDPDLWPRVQHLGNTLTAPEMLVSTPTELLTKLFWDEQLEIIEQRDWSFGCRCSREKVARMLRSLGRTEIEGILAEQGHVEVRCEFCNVPYTFDAVDAAVLFTEPGMQAEGSQARH